jgi:hypothetical protein
MSAFRFSTADERMFLIWSNINISCTQARVARYLPVLAVRSHINRPSRHWTAATRFFVRAHGRSPHPEGGFRLLCVVSAFLPGLPGTLQTCKTRCCRSRETVPLFSCSSQSPGHHFSGRPFSKQHGASGYQLHVLAIAELYEPVVWPGFVFAFCPSFRGFPVPAKTTAPHSRTRPRTICQWPSSSRCRSLRSQTSSPHAGD